MLVTRTTSICDVQCSFRAFSLRCWPCSPRPAACPWRETPCGASRISAAARTRHRTSRRSLPHFRYRNQISSAFHWFSLNRPCSFNLCFCILTWEVASDPPFLYCLWTNLAEIWRTFDHTLGEKSTKILAKLVLRQQRKGVSDTTFEGKILKPKLKGQCLSLNSPNYVALLCWSSLVFATDGDQWNDRHMAWEPMTCWLLLVADQRKNAT